MKSKRKCATKKKISLFIRGLLFLFALYYTSVSVKNNSEPSQTNIISSRKLLNSTNPCDDDPLVKDLNTEPRIPDLFNADQLRAGAWLLYVPGVFYMFLGLSIVCDDFFVPALEAAADALHLSNDVAGATLMAAGGSAPELATSFIGTMLGSDIGFGTIVGSAVFNVLFVIAMCVIYSPEVLELTAWPLFRDCVMYALSLGILAIFFTASSEGEIELWEALVLVGLYALYILIMSKNEALEKMICKKNNLDKMGEVVLDEPSVGESNEAPKAESKNESDTSNRRASVMGNYRAGISSLLYGDRSLEDMAGLEVVAKIHGDVSTTFKSLDEDGNGQLDSKELRSLLKRCGDYEPSTEEVEQVRKALDQDGNGTISLEEFQEWYVRSETRIRKEINKTFDIYDEDSSGTISVGELKKFLTVAMPEGVVSDDLVSDVKDKVDSDKNGTITKQEFEKWYVQSEYFEMEKKRIEAEVEDYEGVSLTMPGSDASLRAKIMYFISMPLIVPMYLTTPNVRKPRWTKYWPFSFFMSIVWIGIYSIMMVQWASTLGLSIGIPPKVMGLIFVAAGTSIPDLLTSVLVAMKGNGDMAISSSIGSNIFDVLIGLPLPWVIKAAIDGPVAVGGDGVGLSVAILFIMIILVCGTIAAVGWKMDKRLAAAFLLFYIIYLVQELLRFYLGPKEC